MRQSLGATDQSLAGISAEDELDVAQRQRAVDEIVRSFAKRSLELKWLSIDRIHLHALARLPDHDPRHHMGVARLFRIGESITVTIVLAEPRVYTRGFLRGCDSCSRIDPYPASIEVVVARNDMDDFDPRSLFLS